jgi:hypothetical protein
VGDSRIRLDYYNTSLEAIPPKYRLGPDATVEELLPNAQAASAERNAVLDETRARISDQGLEWSKDLKAQGKSFDWLENYYQDKRNLTEPNADVYRDIIEASGRSRPNVTIGSRAIVGLENGVNMVAKPLAVVGAGLDGYSLGTQINQSLNTGNWQNTANEASRIGGAWTGAWAFGEAGASGGAALGTLGGPFAFITVPAFTLIGGIGGGIAGYWLGGKGGQNVYNYWNGSRR